MITAKIENSIGCYNNALDKQTCDEIIEYFEHLRSYNKVMDQDSYPSKGTHRKDETVFWCAPDVISIAQGSPILKKFSESFWACYDDYCKEFDILKTAGKHGFYMIRIQRTDPQGGYHTWHFENTNNETSNRLVTFMAYLNDVDEGGETEFLYMSKRYAPKTGTILIWPSTFTHTHRGNTPLNGVKYILTGWLTYFE